MLRTVSVAKVSALMETSRGWTTSSSRMLEIPPWETKRRVKCLLLEISVSMQYYRGLLIESHLADVNPGSFLSLCVSVAQLRDRRDGIKTSVLCQSWGNDLEGICVRTHTVCLHAAQTAGIFSQPQRQLNLWCSTASDQGPADAQEEEELANSFYWLQDPKGFTPKTIAESQVNHCCPLTSK